MAKKEQTDKIDAAKEQINDLKRIKSLENLNELYKNMKGNKNSGSSFENEKILVCAGGGCIASGSLKIKKALEEALESNQLSEKVKIIEADFLKMNICKDAPSFLTVTLKTYR